MLTGKPLWIKVFCKFYILFCIYCRKSNFVYLYEEDQTINEKKNKSNQSADSIDVYIARLSFIAATIVTLGDGLAAVAAGLALQELEKSTNQSTQKQYDQSKQSESTQKQIDYLINELKQIKKIIS